MPDFPNPPDLENFINEEIGLGKEITKKRSASPMKAFTYIIVVIALVLGSFWLSFMVGKSILSPIRKLPEIDTVKKETLDIPEQKVAAALQTSTPEELSFPELAPATPTPPVEKPVAKPEVKKVVEEKVTTPAPAPVVKKVVVPKKKTPKAVSREIVGDKESVKVVSKVITAKTDVKTIYKVRVTRADTKEKSENALAELKSSGFDAFVKDVNGEKFIQTGVFKSRANAEKLLDQLKAKGFGGEVISE